MRRILVFAGVVLALYFGGKHLYRRAGSGQAEGAAEARVRAVFENLRSGAAGEQAAVCQWAVGRPACSEDDLRAAVDAFEAWRREKGLVRVGEFRIDSVETEAEGGVGARVRATVDGQAVVVRVVAGQRLSWSQ